MLANGWQLYKLKDIVKLQNGYAFKSNMFIENEIPIIRINNLQDGKVLIDKKICYSNEFLENNKQYEVVMNDILISMSGSIGKVSKYEHTEPSLLNQRIGKFEILEGIEVDREFLFYYLRSDSFKRAIIKDANGCVVSNISAKSIVSCSIPIPLLDIQKKIVKVLEKAEKTLEKRKKSIALLDELIKSKFIEMFGDPVKNPLGWELKPFLDSGNCKNGMNFSANESGVELQYVGVGDFKDLSKIDNVNALGKVSLNKIPSNEYILQDGDILFVRSNGNKELVGRCLAIYPNGVPTTYSGFCIRYRKTDDKLEIPYLLQVLKTDSMRKNMAGRGANIQNLNQQILGSLMIPVPPIEIQNQFTNFIEHVDKLKFEMEKSLKALEDNFNSLIQKSFNGELFK
ncbi:restriction endonuclease subunit S [Clostridium perfringens]|uniref:Restriction endonuclease subunit S n=1 Tax=Clostridium perfringens TaxID=1502 RepID=A0ABD4PV62_CLOPF|nr:restriction endonuclease subunit S [Clostridium perfringens]MBO3338257.1 restriction endonuclease subunit S [Clostridium perfringens]MBO3385422.1 restriction endonuclease subunit S [Clostridium perfringens]MBO3397836.1 restriction endonuclease subunit S [Clostridium perfringens]MBO3417037.1 restriction endonuclease subunit S [Clostridium perfringens]MBO3420514.1 restriction endonuclease subunit S [Clostridium perfringens]